MMEKALMGVLIGYFLFVPVNAQEKDYLAYAVTEVGEFPLPENLDNLALTVAKHLVQFRWGDYTGSRARITVLPVENTSSVASYKLKLDAPDGNYEFSAESSGQFVPIQGIESIVTDTLFQTGRFTVLERENLEEQFKEQDLGISDRVSKPSAAKRGKTLGAEVNIKLKITNYEPDFSGKSFGGGGLSEGLLGGVSVGKKNSRVVIVFQMIDAETSEIIFSKKVQAIVGKMGFGLGGLSGQGGAFFTSYAKTPIGQAVIAAINVGTYELVKQIGSRPSSGVVIDVDELIALNIGANKKLQIGDKLTARSKGKELIDPETGLSLGTRSRAVGLIEIIEVQEKFSFAKPIGFEPSRLKKGDTVTAVKTSSSPRYADGWTGPKAKKLKRKKERNKKKYGG